MPRTLAALRSWVDEIVVVDAGSTDRTVAIARAMGATVFHQDWLGYGGQKRFAEQLCRNDWVLNIDADEVVTKALAGEILALFHDGAMPAPGAYKLRILNVYPGEKKPRPLASDYNVVRLYHKTKGSYRDHPVFDRVVLKDTVPRQLKAPVFHFSYTSLAHIIEKNNRFSTFRSENSNLRPTHYLLFRLAIEFPMSFLKSYILRRHFTGGWKGFYYALCFAFMRTTRIAKMLESATAPRELSAKSSQPLPALKPVRNPAR
ncbi:MAG: glycosyltransferase family 2 protein [Rhodomicrobium sp.]|nr:glycosyltransferase family 2 protein [Rhodomicrobium sp.]